MITWNEYRTSQIVLPASFFFSFFFLQYIKRFDNGIELAYDKSRRRHITHPPNTDAPGRLRPSSIIATFDYTSDEDSRNSLPEVPRKVDSSFAASACGAGTALLANAPRKIFRDVAHTFANGAAGAYTDRVVSVMPLARWAFGAWRRPCACVYAARR